LDYLPGIKTSSAQLAKTGQDAAPEDVMQREMLKICFIKARVFYNLADRRHAESSTVRTLHGELQTFHSHLPRWMTLDQLLVGERSNYLRNFIFYVHIFYLSAIMLLHRKLLSQLVSVEPQPPHPSDPCIRTNTAEDCRWPSGSEDGRPYLQFIAGGWKRRRDTLAVHVSTTAGVFNQVRLLIRPSE
jgi:hypothetical protein